MRKRILIDGVDYAPHLMKDGFNEVESAIEDETGENVFANATMKFSNLNGDLSSLIRGGRLKSVTVYADDVKCFQGEISGDGFRYDVDNEIAECECLSAEYLFAAKAREQMLSTLQGTQQARQDMSIMYRSLNPPSQWSVNRKFYKVGLLISIIAGALGANGNTMLLDDVLRIGGVLSTNSTASPLPEMSCYDFLTAVAKLTNSIWWLDFNRRFYFVPKRTFFATYRNTQRLQLPRLRDSLSIQYKKTGWDKIIISYQNAKDETLNGVHRASITRPGYAVTSERKIDLPFKIPDEHVTTDQSHYAVIPLEDETTNIYLVKTMGREYSPINEQRLRAQVALDYFHTFDLYGGAEFEATYSILDDSSPLSRMGMPYVWVDSSAQSMPFFARKMRANLSDETLTVEAIGNEYYG